jgi:uncharacterized protein YkwD
MFTLNNLALLALAGTTIAAPAPFNWKDWSGNWQAGQGWHHDAPSATGAAASTSTVWDIATATVTMAGSAPTWTAPAYSAPAVTDAPAPSASPAAFYSAPASGDWSSAVSSAAPPTGTGYMAVVSQWRAAGGLPALTQDSTLEGNALKTAVDGNGQMKHELNPGSMAQVLAPGDANNFESVYVGGWLCEVPSLPGLNGICASEAQGWDHSDGETGHADILSSTSYTKIGCALATGIWACDLA